MTSALINNSSPTVSSDLEYFNSNNMIGVLNNENYNTNYLSGIMKSQY